MVFRRSLPPLFIFVLFPAGSFIFPPSLRSCVSNCCHDADTATDPTYDVRCRASSINSAQLPPVARSRRRIRRRSSRPSSMSVGVPLNQIASEQSAGPLADEGVTELQAEAEELASSQGITRPQATEEPVDPQDLDGSSPLASLLSSEALSYFRNPDTGSDIWLVGVEHQLEGYKKFVINAIREIRPQVVMLELCAERATDPTYLPLGVATRSEDGLWWFTPDDDDDDDDDDDNEQTDENDSGGTTDAAVVVGGDEVLAAVSHLRLNELFLKALVTLCTRVAKPAMRWAKAARNAINRLLYVEDEQVVFQNNEMWAACCEAQACGARVLLGDRDGTVTLRREQKRMEEDVQSASWTEESRTNFERKSKGMQMLLNLIDRRLAFGHEMPMTRAIIRKYGELHKCCMPTHHAFMLEERNKIMAENLMAVERNQTTVAVVGFTHLDGIEELLASNGWVPQVL